MRTEQRRAEPPVAPYVAASRRCVGTFTPTSPSSVLRHLSSISHPSSSSFPALRRTCGSPTLQAPTPSRSHRDTRTAKRFTQTAFPAHAKNVKVSRGCPFFGFVGSPREEKGVIACFAPSGGRRLQDRSLQKKSRAPSISGRIPVSLPDNFRLG